LHSSFYTTKLYKYMYIYAHKLAVEAVETGGKMTSLLSKEPCIRYEA